MSNLVIELPSHREQDAFNVRRWDELLRDPNLAKIPGRIETDRHGQVIMSPPASAKHGSFQFRVADLLRDHRPRGEVLTECPISTADGVRAADVAWASEEAMRALGNRSCFSKCPEICIEVLSPGNSQKEIEEKKALYFDAGACEVWICDESGQLTYYTSANRAAAPRSKLCPDFPKRVGRPA